jgi:tetratricopeptide (TPR) repeat protein
LQKFHTRKILQSFACKLSLIFYLFESHQFKERQETMRKDDHRFAEAERQWELGKFKKAVAIFDDLIQDENLPNTARAVVCEYVGRLQIGIWKLKTAERYLRRAIALNDDGVEHHVQLANCLCLQERQEEAWHMIRRLYRRHPEHPAAIHYMGKMADERGMHAQGLALMKKSLRLEPANERFWANLAFTYVMRNNIGAAMVCSEQAMALNPHDDVVQFVHQVASQFEQQEEPVKPAVTKQPPLTAKSGAKAGLMEARRKT